MSLKTLFSTLIHNKPLYLVLLGSTLGFGRYIVQAGGAVFAIIAYHDEGYFTLIGAAIIIGMVAASFLAPMLLKKIPAKPLMIYSTLAAAVMYAAMYFVGFASLYGHDGHDSVNGHHAWHLLGGADHDDCRRGGQRGKADRRAQRRGFRFPA